MLPKVFLTRSLPSQAMELLHSHTQLSFNQEDRVLSKAEIMDRIKDQEGLLCLLTDTIDAEVMDAAPGLKMIANYAVGFNNIDLEAARQRNILVSNTPGVLTEATAELAMTLLLALSRRVVESDQFTRNGQWQGWGPLLFLGKEVFGSTLALIGMGRIGRAMIARAQSFGQKVIYWNRTRLSPEEEFSLGVRYFPLTEIWSQADFFSLHLAYTPDTHHLIGKKQLEQMKAGSFLINTARGAIVDEAELVAALKSGHLGGAGLDVFENEPAIHPVLPGLANVILLPHIGSATVKTRTAIHPELPGLANVILLPHIGSATVKTRTAMGIMAVENLLAGLKGEKPANLVS